MTNESREIVKCRFCGWARPKWSRVNGHNVSGMSSLLRHIDDEHPEQAAQILRYVGDDTNGSLAESEFECTLQ